MEEIKKSFRNPEAVFRPIASFGFGKGSGVPSWAARLSDIRDLGFGGIITSVPSQNYLKGEEEWEALRRTVCESMDRGLLVWIYDEKGFPSGDAGGLVLEGHPEYEAWGLYYMATESNDEVEMFLPKGHIVYLKALRKENGKLQLETAVDLKEALDENRYIRWKSKGEESWKIIAFFEKELYEGTFAASSFVKEARRYINIMDREAVRRFIEVTHEEYFKKIGEHFGNTIKAFFTDESSLAYFRSAYPPTYQPYTALPWHREFPKLFKERYGYNIVEVLPALYNNVGERTRKIRCDYHNLVSELVENSYYKQINDWCIEHKTALTGHPLGEELITENVAFEGNTFWVWRQMGIPGIDCLTSRPENAIQHKYPTMVAAKVCSSAAHLYGKRKTMCETSNFWEGLRDVSIDFEEMLGTVNWLEALGINTIVAFYALKQLPREKWKEYNTYVGRLSSLLSQGTHVADIAVLYPVTGVWANYVRGEGDSLDTCSMISKGYLGTAIMLLTHQRDFDFIDDDSLNRAQIKNDALHIADERYRKLVVPPIDTIKDRTLKKIAEFAQNGGTVIGIDPPPRHSADGNDEFTLETVNDLFEKDIDNKRDYLEKRFRGGGRTYRLHEAKYFMRCLGNADLGLVEHDPRILYVHKHFNEGIDIYFVTNISFTPTKNVFTFSASGKPEVWNPMTGEIREIAYRAIGDKTALNLKLGKYEGVFVVFRQ